MTGCFVADAICASSSVRRLRASSPLARPPFPFGGAFFRLFPEFLRGLCAVAPCRGVASALPGLVLPVARANASRPAQPPFWPRAPLCTSQSCDKLWLPAPRNRRREPESIPLLALVRTCPTSWEKRFLLRLERSIPQNAVEGRHVSTGFFYFVPSCHNSTPSPTRARIGRPKCKAPKCAKGSPASRARSAQRSRMAVYPTPFGAPSAGSYRNPSRALVDAKSHSDTRPA